MLRAVQMMEIPLLKNWVYSVVMGGLTDALVDPGKVDIKFQKTGPTNAPEPTRIKSLGWSADILVMLYYFNNHCIDNSRSCSGRCSGYNA